MGQLPSVPPATKTYTAMVVVECVVAAPGGEGSGDIGASEVVAIAFGADDPSEIGASVYANVVAPVVAVVLESFSITQHSKLLYSVAARTGTSAHNSQVPL